LEDPMAVAFAFYAVGVIVGFIIGWLTFRGDC